MTTDTDTVPVPVTFSVSDIRHMRDAGRLLVVATVAIDLADVEVTLHGVQIVRLPTGRLRCQAPRYRAHDGTWQPAVTMPPELERAIGVEVMVAAGFVPDE